MPKSKFKLPKNPIWRKLVEASAEDLLGKDWRESAEQQTIGCISIPHRDGCREIEWQEGNDLDNEKILTIALVDLPMGGEGKAFTPVNTVSVDSPSGVAAVREFYDNGQLKSLTHMLENGVITDPSPGQPANEEFYKSGCKKSIAHYKDGRWQNPIADVAAVTKFYDKTGIVLSEDNRNNGFSIDLLYGIPSMTCYSEDGKPITGYFSDGTEINEAAIQEIYRNARKQKMLNLASGDGEVFALTGGGLSSTTGGKAMTRAAATGSHLDC